MKWNEIYMHLAKVLRIITLKTTALIIKKTTPQFRNLHVFKNETKCGKQEVNTSGRKPKPVQPALEVGTTEHHSVIST
jgi:hypothetical protein